MIVDEVVETLIAGKRFLIFVVTGFAWNLILFMVIVVAHIDLEKAAVELGLR